MGCLKLTGKKETSGTGDRPVPDVLTKENHVCAGKELFQVARKNPAHTITNTKLTNVGQQSFEAVYKL